MSIQDSKDALKLMATPDFHKEMSALIRSHSPLIYLVTAEEKRVLEYFRHYTVAGGYKTTVWDAFNGMVDLKSMKPIANLSGDNGDELAVLDHILKEAASAEDNIRKSEEVGKSKIYLLLDFHRFLKPCEPDTERRLRTLARMDSNTIVIMVGPHYETTAALDHEMRIIDFPFPNPEELKIALYSAIESVELQIGGLAEKTKAKEEEIIGAVTGLSFEEACSAFGKSICMHRELHIPTILKEKQEVIRKTGILDFYKPEISIDDVGGLGNLMGFLKERKATFGKDAKDYGLPTPKGLLIIGVPGAGKSMVAKAAASLFEMPLLRLDFGALFDAHVGASERKARNAIDIAERVAPAVLWIDEVEKGLSGVKSSSGTDGGVTNRVVGTLLQWMQEKTSPIFLMCTANQHENIPAEFMRAGRFDEVFFVDLPTRSERVSIAEKLLRRKKRNPKDFAATEIALRSDGFTGAEIEKAIDMALFRGYSEGKRDITTDDIVDAFTRFKPISVMRPDVIESMRIWAKKHCICANTEEVVPGGHSNTQKVLELGE